MRRPGDEDHRAQMRDAWFTHAAAVLQIVDEVKPKETSTDRIERVLDELCAEKKEDPFVH